MNSERLELFLKFVKSYKESMEQRFTITSRELLWFNCIGIGLEDYYSRFLTATQNYIEDEKKNIKYLKYRCRDFTKIRKLIFVKYDLENENISPDLNNKLVQELKSIIKNGKLMDDCEKSPFNRELDKLIL